MNEVGEGKRGENGKKKTGEEEERKICRRERGETDTKEKLQLHGMN